MLKKPFVSIQIPSNKADKLQSFFNHIEENTHDYEALEILVNLDEGDTEISAFLDAQKQIRPFTIKYIKTFSGGFYNSWKPINDLLSIMHPDAYFLTFLSDEVLFKTKGWDDILKKYIGYYPDHIFRLRASQYRYRNYSDLWECGFSPDSVAFYTKKWVDINGDWAPCFSSDAFQQCVAYHLFNSDPFLKEQYYRDIPVSHIEFGGEGASIGLTPAQEKQRYRGGLKAWFILMSHRMQTEAARRAMLLKAHITAATHANVAIIDKRSKQKINIIDVITQKKLHTYSYKLSRLIFFLRNNFRKLAFLYYAGGGRKSLTRLNGIRFNLTYYLSARYTFLTNLHDACNNFDRKAKRWITAHKKHVP